MTLLAQLDDVAVFQTAAFQVPDFTNTDVETTDIDMAEQIKQRMSQSGQTSYGELNLGLHVHDDATQVLSNRMHLLAAINEQLNEQQLPQQRLLLKRMHWVNQVHGKHVHDVDNTPLSMQTVDADAMVSQQANVGLAIMTADCVPIVLYQPASGQIAAIHAGWQGLACGVIKVTAEHFDSTIGQVMAWIGVCISQTHYEVGKHIRDQLLTGCVENQLLTPSSTDNFNQRYCTDTDTDTDLERVHKKVDKLLNIATISNNKVKLNLPKLAADQLMSVGIKVNTKLPVACSYEDKHYYSYRRQTHLQQPATGRMALIVVRSSAIPNVNHT